MEKIYLLIDTAHKYIRMAIIKEGEVLGVSEFASNKDNEKNILKRLDELLTEAFSKSFENLSNKQEGSFGSENYYKKLSAIFCSRGPGSYTGIRIGVSIAKTIAYALNIKLYSFSSLQAFNISACDSLINTQGENTKSQNIYLSLFDANSGRAYSLFNSEDDIFLKIQAESKDLENIGEKILNLLESTPNSLVVNADGKNLLSTYIENSKNKEKFDHLLETRRIILLDSCYKYNSLAKYLNKIKEGQDPSPFSFVTEYVSLSQAERLQKKKKKKKKKNKRR